MNRRTLVYLCSALLLPVLGGPAQAKSMSAEEFNIQQLEQRKLNKQNLFGSSTTELSDAERIIQELERAKQLPKQMSDAERIIHELEQAKRDKLTNPQLPEFPNKPPIDLIGKPAVVPVPAAAWLMLSGLLGLGLVGRSRRHG